MLIRRCQISANAADLLDKPDPIPFNDHLEDLRLRLKGSGLSKGAITDDLYTFNVAGAFNTGTIVSITLFYILSTASIRQKLSEELSVFARSASPTAELDKLPYLVGLLVTLQNEG